MKIKDIESFDELVRTATLAADGPASRLYEGTFASRMSAGVRAALAVLIQNGMITVTPREDWPKWISLDPEDSDD